MNKIGSRKKPKPKDTIDVSTEKSTNMTDKPPSKSIDESTRALLESIKAGSGVSVTNKRPIGSGIKTLS